jgi:hypothetical protein
MSVKQGRVSHSPVFFIAYVTAYEDEGGGIERGGVDILPKPSLITEPAKTE